MLHVTQRPKDFQAWISEEDFSEITSIDLFLVLKAALQAFKPFQIGKALTLKRNSVVFIATLKDVSL